MWKFLVKNQSIEILEREVLADHQIRYVQFKFIFDGDWKKFHKVVQFTQCDETYCMVLGYDGTTCYLPPELHVGAVKMSVFGYDAKSDTTVRATTVPVTLNIRPSGFVGDDPPIPPTPDLYTQLLQKIGEAAKGADGKSAYEIAVEHGFVGMEEQWLESLKGKDGEATDMSEYPKMSEVMTIIEREIAPVAEDAHSHENKETLDSLTPELMTDLNGLQQFEDRTTYEIQTLNEAMDNLRTGMHTHDNMDVLDSITEEMLDSVSDYGAFEDWTKEQIHTLNENVSNFSNTAHTHENKGILDATTAAYTAAEQEKLAGITPDNYATKEALTAEALSIREAMIPLERELHSHQNKAVLDTITAEILEAVSNYGPFEDWTREEIHTLHEEVDNFSNTAHTHENKDVLDGITGDMVTELEGLQQFEDSIRYELQTVKESVEPVVSQAHWHHNLTVLNSITSAKVAEWDSISTLKTQVNGLSTELTIYKSKCEKNAESITELETDINSIQETLADLQRQINALKNNGYTVLFECGEDAFEKYSSVLGFVLDGGFRTMTNMCLQYPNFCCEGNNYALYYNQEDFNWDAQVLTCVEKRLNLTSDSKIQIRYLSGATEDGQLYLVPPPGGKIDVPFTLYVSGEIRAGRAVELDFQWLQSQKFITTETDCTGIQAGEYYLAWIGRSNNTHPIIQSVKVLEVEE